MPPTLHLPSDVRLRRTGMSRDPNRRIPSGWLASCAFAAVPARGSEEGLPRPRLVTGSSPCGGHLPFLFEM